MMPSMYDHWGMLGDNPDEIRPFPPAATPVQFPQFIPTTPQYTRDALRLERVHKRLTRLTNPSGLKAEDITDLNVHITQNVALDALIPNGSDGQRCLPSPQWDSTASKKTDQLPRQLYTGEQAPDRTLYLARKAELDFDSDEAYRAVHRQASKRDGKIAKVGNYFKFWAALEHVSRHWDTSRDTEEEIKGKVNRPRPSSHDEKSDAMDVDPPAQIESYTGQRVGSGIDMPPTFRENCVKSFIEIIAWLFRCQLQNPNVQPRLALGTCLCPVPLTQYVFKTPVDRALARSGRSEGPLAGVFCRSTTQFQDPSSPGNGSLAEMIDLLQELLSMLVVAQERCREGKADIVPGNGKWYTTVPRWGGGLGGDIGNETGGNTDEVPPSKKSTSPSIAVANEDDKKPSKDPMTAVRNYRRTVRASGAQRQRKKEPPAEAWKALRPSPSLRDPNVKYQAIGKTKGSGYDNIFLFSALNHHISIVRLRVYDEYLDFLETGKVPPNASPSDPSSASSLTSGNKSSSRTTIPSSSSKEWDKLEMARSRWFDLLQREDRLEVMRGVWGVLAYLTQSKDQDEEVEACPNYEVGTDNPIDMEM